MGSAALPGPKIGFAEPDQDCRQSGKFILDKLIQKEVDAAINKQYAGELKEIKIPQFGGLFSSDLSVQIDAAAVVAGYANLEADISASGNSGGGSLPAVVQPDASAPRVGLSVNGNGVQMVFEAASHVFPFQQGFHKKKTHKVGPLGHFGGGVKGHFTVYKPSLTISGNKAKADARVAIHVDGGVEAFGKWIWVNISPPDVNMEIFVDLKEDGKTAKVQVTGVGTIHVDLDCPHVLHKVCDLINRLFDDIAKLFRGDVSRALEGHSFDLLSLPSTLPGTSVKVDMSFDQLAFADSGVDAVVRVSN